MDTYIYISDEWRINLKDKSFESILTGEVLVDTSDKVKVIESEKLRNKADKNVLKTAEEIIGIEDYLKKYHVGWKKKYQFNKIYRLERRDLLSKTNLSINASALMLYFESYIEYPTNKIVNSNGNSFTNKQLQSLTGLGNVQLKAALNELETNNIIKRTGLKRARQIYYNPNIASGGIDILHETIGLFDKEYKPPKKSTIIM